MKLSSSFYLLWHELRYAWRNHEEDAESSYLATYGHPNAAEYLFIRHLYDSLEADSGPGERFLGFQDRFEYVAMYAPHIWDSDGDVDIDRGGFRVVTMDHKFALDLVNSPGKMPEIYVGRPIEVFITDLSGRDWARTLERIIAHEHHFMTPMAWKQELVQHYLASFHPPAFHPQPATVLKQQDDAEETRPDSSETASKVALDLDLIGQIEHQDTWI